MFESLYISFRSQRVLGLCLNVQRSTAALKTEKLHSNMQLIKATEPCFVWAYNEVRKACGPPYAKGFRVLGFIVKGLRFSM